MDLFVILLIVVIATVIRSIFLAFKVYESGVIAGRNDTSYTINKHRKVVNSFLRIITLSVVCIELMLRVKRGNHFEINLSETLLGQVHFALDVVFILVLVTMRLFLNGEDHPIPHRKLAKVAGCSYLGILITGTWLMFKL